MRSFKRVANATSAAVLTLSSLMSLGFTGVAHAASGSDTCTWTGTTDTKFSTATNWSNCSSAAPVNGDNLVFDVATLTSNQTLTNDITGLSVGTITFQGNHGTNYTNFTLNGSGITVTGGITDSSNVDNLIGTDITLGADVTLNKLDLGRSSGNETLNLNGHNLTVSGSGSYATLDKVTGSGNLAATSGGQITLNNTSSSITSDWSGTLSVTGAGSGVWIGTKSVPAANAISIADGSTFTLCGFNGASVANPLTVGGRGTSQTNGGVTTYSGAINDYPVCGMGAGSGFQSGASVNWTGPITLTANTTVGGQGEFTVSGPLQGKYTLTEEPGTDGKVTIASSNNQSASSNGTQATQVQTTTYSANSPNTPLGVSGSQIAIVDGTYGDTFVSSGGILKGTGTVNSLDARSGGIVAPGHSPGTLTVLSVLTMEAGSTYQTEIKDKTPGDFDQIVVGSSSDTTGNDVMLGDTNGNPTLDVQLYSGANIKAGDTFEIINNLSQTAVSGTFANLPEGATFKVGNGTMKISYQGGDGNDVVLTALTAITAPDTGFAFVSAHPAATFGVTVVAAGFIFAAAKLNRKAPARATAKRR